MPGRLKMSKKVVGAKQTLKALQSGQAKQVYIAKDADAYVTETIVQQCAILGVGVVPVETMAELGKACLIDVGAAVACIVE